MSWTHRKVSIYSDEYQHCTCEECETTRERQPMTACPVCATRQLGEDLCPMHPQASRFSDQMKTKAMNLKLGPPVTCPGCAQPQPPGSSTCVNCNKKDQQMTDDVCAWVSSHTWHREPFTTAYILGCICDKCGTIITVSLCTACAQTWINTTAPNARCGNCNGTMSWKLQDIRNETSLEHINPSELL